MAVLSFRITEDLKIIVKPPCWVLPAKVVTIFQPAGGGYGANHTNASTINCHGKYKKLITWLDVSRSKIVELNGIGAIPRFRFQ